MCGDRVYISKLVWLSMCFTWETVDGFGPIWIFGDRLYVDALEKFNYRNEKVKVRQRAISMHNWANSEEMKIIKVKKKNINTTQSQAGGQAEDPIPTSGFQAPALVSGVPHPASGFQLQAFI